MFLVKDSVSARKAKILSLLKSEPPIAVLLASAHLEWILNRAIINLSKTPNREIRSLRDEERWSGLGGYERAWKKFVSPTIKATLSKVICNWDDLKEAVKLRHKLIHGISSCSSNYAEPRIKIILSAADDVIRFCKEQDADVTKRLRVRKK